MTDAKQEITKNIEDAKEALQLENIQSTAIEPILQQWAGLIAFLPNLITAGIALLVGLIIGYIIGKITASILKRVGVDRMIGNAGVSDMMTERGLKSSPSQLIGKMVFWCIAFTAFIPATELLGIEELVRLTQAFVLFLPKIVIAIIILLFGFVIANSLRKSINGGQDRLGLTSTKTVGNMVYGLAVAVTVVVALNQLELDTRLLHTVLITVIASICAAIALAIGLGGRELAQNLVSGFYARESFEPGSQISFDGHTGRLLEVRAQNTLLEQENGDKISIPNSHLFQYTVKSSKPEDSAD